MNIVSIVYYSKKCLNQNEPVEEFFKANLSQLFNFVPYSPWIAFVGQLVNVAATFAWNYMDLFVMMISLGLTSRFRQINDDLQRIKGEVMSEDFWAIRRTQYRRLAGLCSLIDDAISPITLLSLSNNLFFISVQLLRSIR